MKDEKHLNQYYTPDLIADNLVSKALSDITETGTILEPSCGQGALIDASIRFIQSKFPHLSDQSIQKMHFANDIDEKNTSIIQEKYPHINVTNMCFTQLKGTYDVVLCNPPWSKFNRRGNIITDGEFDIARWARSAFKERPKSWETTAFLCAMQRLKKDGKYGVIVPCSSFLVNLNTTLLRRNLFDKYGIQELEIFTNSEGNYFNISGRFQFMILIGKIGTSNKIIIDNTFELEKTMIETISPNSFIFPIIKSARHLNILLSLCNGRVDDDPST